jgi:hypothetical protein
MIRLLTALLALVVAPLAVAAQPTPARVSDAKVEAKFAAKPKELSAAVKKGLEYLVKNQRDDGGWNQGGLGAGITVKVVGSDGKSATPKDSDESDVADTCAALLALVRAGNTPTDGDHQEAVKKGLAFVLGAVEKAEAGSLSLGGSRTSIVQLKLGPNADIYLANWLLAELRGRAGSHEKRLAAALEKTMTALARHQTADGWIANFAAAPELALALANKGIARAIQNGVEADGVAGRVWAVAQGSSRGTVTLTPLKPIKVPVVAGFPGEPAGPEFTFGGPGNAGLTLYRIAFGAGNAQDAVNALRAEAGRAKAQKAIDALKKAGSENDRIQAELAKRVRDDRVVAGFGSAGGEEYLSYILIGESLLVRGGKNWADWDAKMVKELEKSQDKDGSWAGHHCVAGKTFCTSAALLVLTTDRTPFTAEVLPKAK